MAIHADVLLDRMHLRNQLTRWRMVAILLGVLGILAILNPLNKLAENKDYIARVDIEGFITDDFEQQEALAKLRDDKHVKAVVVRVDSQGGTLSGGERTYHAIRRIAAVKPVVSVMRSIATSGGYMAAVGAPYIIATPGTLTGSIGVVIQSVQVTDFLDKVGVKPLTYKSAELKTAGSPLEVGTPAMNAAIMKLVTDGLDIFKVIVAEGRKMPMDQVNIVADGRVFHAKEAKQLKLIDAIGDEEDALNWLRTQKKLSPDLEMREFSLKKKNKSPIVQLLEGSLGFDFSSNAALHHGGLLAVWEL
jgi:protease-4